MRIIGDTTGITSRIASFLQIGLPAPVLPGLAKSVLHEQDASCSCLLSVPLMLSCLRFALRAPRAFVILVKDKGRE